MFHGPWVAFGALPNEKRKPYTGAAPNSRSEDRDPNSVAEEAQQGSEAGPLGPHVLVAFGAWVSTRRAKTLQGG
ncbi:hypothetical protein WJX84_004619 [Apatococcus fuscideae]|uniref:Uncharacterized protein n=1 Tax=Apatococcus fuscideae TaxID=2026836 RepID=A0AAW1SWI4_9CHLO